MLARYIGLSNKTPYGLMKFLQNSYNLLCQNFDSGLAECCHHESYPLHSTVINCYFLLASLACDRISLLAYSPLAMGILSGKYHSSDDGGPPDAIMNLFKGRNSEGEFRYNLSSPKLKEVVKKKVNPVASQAGVSASQWNNINSLLVLNIDNERRHVLLFGRNYHE